MPSIASYIQRRLLDSSKVEDYFFAFIIPLAPVVFSQMIGIWKHTDIEEFKFTGYQEAFNQHSLIVALPISLFFLRILGSYLFGINVGSNHRNRVPLLTIFNNEVQAAIHENLKKTALSPTISFIVLILDILFHSFDIGAVLKQYLLKFLGHEVNYNQIYWANLCLVKKDIDVGTNFLFMLSVYLGQFIIFFIAVTAIILFLLHNIFYLRLIYQRSRISEDKIQCHIVLNFDDYNRRFGLSNLYGVFNIQLVALVFAGVVVLCSRITLTQKIDFPTLVNFNFADSFSERRIGDLLENLFPEFGQYVIVLLWLFTFIVVLLPTFVKFLPFFSRNIASQGWLISDYLREFIQPKDDSKYPLSTTAEVNDVARKFAQNSFWPSGDDFSKLIFWFVFFTCFAILFPLNPISAGIFFIVSFLLAETFLNFYRWVLGHVDQRLVDRSADVKLGDMIIMGDNFEKIGEGATIVNRSTVERSFNRVREEFDEDTVNALKRIEEEINKSGNQEAAELFEGFNEELQKPKPKKTLLRSSWKGIVEALPAVTQLTKVVADITKLFI